MGSTGKSTTSTKTAIKSAEDKIYSGTTETAIIISQDGSTIIDKSDGNKSQVAFTPDEVAKMNDAILTHNHPSSSAFSAEDVNILVQANLSEIRAVLKDGGFVYSLKRNSTNNLTQNFAVDYWQALEDYKANTVNSVWASSNQTQSDANMCNKMVDDYRVKWLTDNSNKYGYTFSKQKRG